MAYEEAARASSGLTTYNFFIHPNGYLRCESPALFEKSCAVFVVTVMTYWYLSPTYSGLPPVESETEAKQIVWTQLRACAERRKIADRKQKEENQAEGERTEEEHDVHLLSRATGLSLRCNRRRMGDPGAIDPRSQARRTT